MDKKNRPAFCGAGSFVRQTFRLEHAAFRRIAPRTFLVSAADDGAGTPTVQDGDILEYRAFDQTLHPAPKDSALNPTAVAPLLGPVSDPPTQAEVQAAYDKINELIAALIRP